MPLTREEAIAIYKQGQEIVVSKLVADSVEIDNLLQKLKTYQSKDVTRPSGKKAPFEVMKKAAMEYLGIFATS